jgi:hypothetical protein
MCGPAFEMWSVDFSYKRRVMIMNIDLKTLQLNLWKLVQGMMHFRKVSERFVIELYIKRASEDDASHGGGLCRNAVFSLVLVMLLS